MSAFSRIFGMMETVKRDLILGPTTLHVTREHPEGIWIHGIMTQKILQELGHVPCPCGVMRLQNGTSQSYHMETMGVLLNIVVSISMGKKWKS